jgi:hypothetical protein
MPFSRTLWQIRSCSRAASLDKEEPRERRKAEIRLRRTTEPVEKVCVGPVGGPGEPENKAKTLQKRRIQSLKRGQKQISPQNPTRMGRLTLSGENAGKHQRCKSYFELAIAWPSSLVADNI